MMLLTTAKTIAYSHNTGHNTESTKTCGLLPGCSEKIGSIPFASLIATIICLAGIGVFCGTLYQALHIFLVQIVDELFKFKVGW